MNTNLTILSGRLTKTPELKTLPNGKYLLGGSIAVNRLKDEADFFEFIAFEKIAETMATYCDKGSRVILQGRLQTRTYKDKNGENRKVVEVVVERVEIVDFKEKAEVKEEPRIDKNSHLFNQTPPKKEEEIDEDGWDLPF